MLRDDLETLILLLKIKQTDLQRVHLPSSEKSTFLQQKKNEESLLINEKLKHLEHIRKQIPS